MCVQAHGRELMDMFVCVCVCVYVCMPAICAKGSILNLLLRENEYTDAVSESEHGCIYIFMLACIHVGLCIC